MTVNEVVLWVMVAALAFVIGQGRIQLRSAREIVDGASDLRLDTWANDSGQIVRIYRKHTMQRLVTCYNLDELRTLAFDIGLNHEQISGDTINTYAMELLEYCERRGMLQYLLAGMR